VRKVFFTALISAALLVVVPASALARGHSSRSHRRVHHVRVHHVRTHLKRFGTDVTSPGSTTGSSRSDTAGTVASFTGGVLTIRLNDGSEIHGLVTDATELECTAGMTTMMRSDGGGSGGSGGDQSGDQSGDQGEHHGGDQGGDRGDDQGAGDDNGDTGDAQSCSSSALTPGAVVQGAELKVSSAGAIWDKVELAQ
jgi:hypothetical protein